ncbi:hypothetical protein [Flavobacterium psychraquaticum]|uniref:hypothetical protein n=1 Tax=Flavobacterium psychraquaticum TaxID=3103958 RepID=UPI002ACD68EA|nr:hypothetical protein [Flavobacterium sp. LB-N7T]
MKKTLTLIALLFISLSYCQKDNTKTEYSTIYEYEKLIQIGRKIDKPIEKFDFYKHLFYVKQLNSNKETNKTFWIYSDSFLFKIIKEYMFKNEELLNIKQITQKDLVKKDEFEDFTLGDKIKELDLLLNNNSETFESKLRELFIAPMCGELIENINNNFIYLYADCGSGGSVRTATLFINDKNIIDLGSGYDKLSKKEYERLESIIKSKIKDFVYISGRSGTKTEISENGNFIFTFSGQREDEADASGGSLKISYETSDLKSFIPTSVKVENWNN